MLVLERKESECVVLVDQAGRVIGRVRVVEKGGRSAGLRLAFEDFSQAVGIHREELWAAGINKRAGSAVRP